MKKRKKLFVGILGKVASTSKIVSNEQMLITF